MTYVQESQKRTRESGVAGVTTTSKKKILLYKNRYGVFPDRYDLQERTPF